MQLFYTINFNGNSGSFNEEESWHCAKVLRMKPGDPVNVTDGNGHMIKGKLVEVNPGQCLFEALEQRFVPKPAGRVHIAIAPTKSAERFEWFLEKATETGIDRITPLICEHSERVTIKKARLEKVIIAAMKQSLSAWLPELSEPQKFPAFLSTVQDGMKFIAYCPAGDSQSLISLYRAGNHATILIGPEGDFSIPEVSQAEQAGFLPVSLGHPRYRTETAGIVAVHTIRLLNSLHETNHKTHGE